MRSFAINFAPFALDRLKRSSEFSEMKPIYLTGAVRTPIGRFGGSLQSWTAADLGTAVAKETLRRANVRPDQVDDSIWGCARQAGGGPNVGRQITFRAGERQELSLAEIDLVELNEAFAAQVIACDRDLQFDHDRLNPNGGAIALGHPIGCTGVRITTTLLHEMKKRQVKRGLATLCISGGMGIALLVERV